MRSIVLMISLASAGALLLTAVGIAMAVRANNPPEEAAPKTSPNVLKQAPAIPVPSDSSGNPVDGPSAEGTEDAVPDKPTDQPLPAPEAEAKSVSKKPSTPAPSQKYTINIGETGYSPAVLEASSESPITLTVAQGEGCAAGFTIPALGIEKDNSSGPVTFSLGRLKAGTYRFACAMDMVEGTIVVR